MMKNHNGQEKTSSSYTVCCVFLLRTIIMYSISEVKQTGGGATEVAVNRISFTRREPRRQKTVLQLNNCSAPEQLLSFYTGGCVFLLITVIMYSTPEAKLRGVGPNRRGAWLPELP